MGLLSLCQIDFTGSSKSSFAGSSSHSTDEPLETMAEHWHQKVFSRLIWMRKTEQRGHVILARFTPYSHGVPIDGDKGPPPLGMLAHMHDD